MDRKTEELEQLLKTLTIEEIEKLQRLLTFAKKELFREKLKHLQDYEDEDEGYFKSGW